MYDDKHGWDRRKTKLCNVIADRTIAFEWLHNHTATKKEKMNKWLGMISAFGSFLTGVGGLFSTLMDSPGPQRITFNVLVLLFSIVGMVKKRLNLGESVGKHRNMEGKYQLLTSDIKKEIILDPHDREEFSKFYVKIQNTETGIRNERGSANIDDNMYDQYKKHFGERALDYSTLFGNIPYSTSDSELPEVSQFIAEEE